MAFPKITIDTLVAAPLDTVWTAYTAPAHITRWNFASDDWCCPSAENDMRVGGTYKARMEAKDGSFGFDFEAVYDEVSPKERLVYTLGDGRRVETTFTPKATGSASPPPSTPRGCIRWKCSGTAGSRSWTTSGDMPPVFNCWRARMTRPFNQERQGSRRPQTRHCRIPAKVR
ncbi:SRPBCC domain-containing protein [Seohaeicola zhoushanensis]